jgi:hypothetical protein
VSLDDIAAGLSVTTRQTERGVAVRDETDAPLAERLAGFADDLPCTPEATATVVERYAAGASVGDAARTAGVAPVTAAKALHLLGEDVSPLAPTGREVVRDWLDARLSRSEAKELTRADDDEFALAVYVETHEPIPGAEEALAGALRVDRGDPLADARSDLGDLL